LILFKLSRGDIMKITGVSVYNLFGIFTHHVPFKIQDHITIIFGPNGFGKTILFRMIHAIFSHNYYELVNIPFGKFEVNFDDGRQLVLKTIESLPQEEKTNKRIIVELFKNSNKIDFAEIKIPQRQDIHFPLELIERSIPELIRTATQSWIFAPTQEELTLEDVLNRFVGRLPIPPNAIKQVKEPEWVTEILNSVHVHVINTQRLSSFPTRRRRDYDVAQPLVPAVSAYSEELSGALQNKLMEYGVLSQSLDSTFPTRLITGTNKYDMSLDDLRNNLTNLEIKRLYLMETGLLDKETARNTVELSKVNDNNMNVLQVYLSDTQKKLAVFDDLSNKVELFLNIVNSRFTYKKMYINKKSGFTFKSNTGDNLSPVMLSSGEQHEIVLFYELLFKIKPGSLILIDEPELSLHVVWQQQFVKDIQKITNIARFDVLIATHAPQIIHDRFDLLVELKGPNEEELNGK
jgi:predicted ATP-binding protein involved in virulence